MVKAEIIGLKELKRQLKKIPKELTKEIDTEIGLSIDEMIKGAVRDAHSLSSFVTG